MTDTARPRILRAGDGPVSMWSAPNLICIGRILLVPVFVAVFLAGVGEPALRWWATLLFVVTIATDSVDGHLARSRNLITDLGKILDPIADKAITGAALIVLSVVGELPVWVTAIILLREVGITVYRFAVLRTRVIPASKGGKLKTVLQSVAITLALAPFPALLGDWMNWINTVFMTAAFLVTVVTGVQYLIDDRRLNAR